MNLLIPLIEIEEGAIQVASGTTELVKKFKIDFLSEAFLVRF
jgi:hypothetical protein